MFITIIVFIAILSLLVFVHELGHFFTARRCGIKCAEFGFGYPPRAWGLYKNRQGRWRSVWGGKEVKEAASTIYSINWVPLGGFVKIKGENGEEAEDEDSFAAKAWWQRMLVLSAGVLMNIVLAVVLISVGMMIGLPQVLDGVKPQAKVSHQQIQIVQVFPNTPAEKAGLRLGDVILTVDSKPFIDDVALATYMNEHLGQPVEVTVASRGQNMTTSIVPELQDSTGQGGIGIAIAEIGQVRYPWYIAMWEGTKATFWLLWAIILGILGIFQSLFAGKGLGAEVAGPVGIATLTGQMVDMGWLYVWQFTALLSLNLAILNFLPIPALDGGRVLFLIIEKIKGRPVKKETEALIHNIGFILLMLLVVAVTFRDITKIGCLTCRLSAWLDSF